MKQLVLCLAALIVTAVAFQNCGGAGMKFDGATPLVESLSSISEPVPETHIPEPANTVCDPLLTSAGVCKSGSGLLGNLYYLLNGNGGNGRFSGYVMNGIKADITLQMSTFNIPAHAFDVGFIGPDGQALKDNSGQKLTSDFGFDLRGFMKLRSSDTSGYYQFKTTSDDGSNFYIDGQQVINNDGTHSMISVESSLISLALNKRYAVQLEYFQGPPQDIGLQVFVRKCSSNQTSSCGAYDIVPAEWFSH